jgi:hypothetical protein
MSFLAGAGRIPPRLDGQTKNLLKNRVLNPPRRVDVKFGLAATQGLSSMPVDNPPEGE